MDLKKKTTPAKKKEQAQRRLSSLLALDFAGSGVKAVRLKKTKDRILLSGADILPPVNLDAGERPELPKSLSAYYTAICIGSPEARLRVFGHVMQDNETLPDVIRENLSVSDEFRVAGRVLLEGRNKRESSILGVAFPEAAIHRCLEIFAGGAPAPHSMEVSGLAAFSAFLFNRGKQTAGQTVCLLEIGMNYTYAAFLHKNQLQLINRFDVGGNTLRKQVQSALGVDMEMAGSILADGSVDVAAPVNAALSPFIKQLSIYREFVERQTKTALSGVYLSGGEAVSAHWQHAVQEVTGLVPVVWSPFDRLDGAADVFPENLKGQESRFAAAVGAALAGLEAL
jgi:hypothetical protein